MEVHSNCGGRIVDRKCQKCGKTWGKLRHIIAQDIEPEPPARFDETEYRKRIRRGDDIPHD